MRMPDENLLDRPPHPGPSSALLKVIDNPAQDIYLAAAMLGPMFGFTDDDLVRLRAQSAAMQKKAQEEQGAKETGKKGFPHESVRCSAAGGAEW